VKVTRHRGNFGAQGTPNEAPDVRGTTNSAGFGGVNYAGSSKERGISRIILLLGAPGCGKGTQSSLLAGNPGILSISTGAILREEAKKDNPAGYRLRHTLSTGTLVDDGVVCDAVASRLRSFQGKHGASGVSLILDGFPRTVGQARVLDMLLESQGLSAPLVLHLDVPHEVLRRRLAGRRQCVRCGAIYNLASGRSAAGPRCQVDGGALVERDDDSEGVVLRRLASYEAETLPVLEYYRKRGCNDGTYRRLDGHRAPGEIASEVRDIVGFAATAVAA
jgi:adenylate kinase